LWRDKSFAPTSAIAEKTMMPRCLLAVLCMSHLFVAALLGADVLNPLLAPHAERYTAGLEDLRGAKKSQLAREETEYVQKLDAAIATAKDEKAIAVLRREREGVVKGMIAPANPDGLSPEVTAARKAFFSGVGKASADFAAAKKKLDDAYLKTLADLAKQARGKSGPPGLAAEVTAEKRRVVSGN
jgi:hypothetical protein